MVPFHLSIPVDDLERARAFYVDTLGCDLGRVGERRIDIDFFGHHVVAHLAPSEATQTVGEFHSDGEDVSVRHFGAVVPKETWEALAERLSTNGTVDFTMSPRLIREGTIEAQHIMMMRDGCGNIVELKSIPSERLFASAPA